MASIKTVIATDGFTDGENTTIQVFTTLSALCSIIGTIYPAYLLYQSKDKVTIHQHYFGVLLVLNFVSAFMLSIGRGSFESHDLCQFQGVMVQWCGLSVQLWTTYISYKMYLLVAKRANPRKILEHRTRDALIIIASSFSIAMIFLCVGAYGKDHDWCWIDRKNAEFRFYALYVSLISCMSICAMFLVAIYISLLGSDDEGLAITERSVGNKLSAYVLIFIFCWSFGLINRIVESTTGKPDFATALLQAIFQPLQGLLNTLVFVNAYQYFNKSTSKSTKLFGEFEMTSNEGGDEEVEDLGCTNPISIRESITANPGNSKKQGDSTFSTYDPSEMKQSSITLSKIGEVFDKRMFEFHSVMNAWEKDANISTSLVNIENNIENLDRTRYGFKFNDIPHAHRHHAKFIPKAYSIFSTTFNLGEAKPKEFEPKLKDWLVKGHDIYNIGMQEALNIDTLREMMAKYLGGPSKYVMFSKEIGSDSTSIGYHGYIALTLFVRKSEWDKGAIRETVTGQSNIAAGANLGVAGKATNKGGVGIPLQIHDSIVCFITCHLPSDSKGISKLGKRNQAARSIIEEMVLAPLDIGASSCAQFDHVIFSGDLNYRLCSEDMSKGGEICKIVANAAKKEYAVVEKYMPNNWLERRAQLLLPLNDEQMPKGKELKALLDARAKSCSAWNAVGDQDELTRVINHGHAFSGFEESNLCFAPSYKRNNGTEGDINDLKDSVSIFKSFSHTEGMEIEGVKPRQAPASPANSKDAKSEQKRLSKMRPPSYTDRVLVHSLADRTSRLAFQAYDICEKVDISDHRPVSMAMTLEVNSSVIYPINFVKKLDFGGKKGNVGWTRNHNSDGKMTVIGDERYYLFELILSDLSISLIHSENNKTTQNTKKIDDEDEEEEEDGEDIDIDLVERMSTFHDVNIGTQSTDIDAIPSPMHLSQPDFIPAKDKKKIITDVQSVSVSFPLQTKDPLVQFRRIRELAKALQLENPGNTILCEINDSLLRAVEVRDRVKAPASDLNTYVNSLEDLVTEVPCTMDTAVSTNSKKEAVIRDVVKCKPLRVFGAVVPELGVHCLVSLQGCDHHNVGEMVIPLHQLVDLTSNKGKKIRFSSIPVTHGGTTIGLGSGQATLSLLTILSSRKEAEKEAGPKISRDPHDIV